MDHECGPNEWTQLPSPAPPAYGYQYGAPPPTHDHYSAVPPSGYPYSAPPSPPASYGQPSYGYENQYGGQILPPAEKKKSTGSGGKKLAQFITIWKIHRRCSLATIHWTCACVACKSLMSMLKQYMNEGLFPGFCFRHNG